MSGVTSLSVNTETVAAEAAAAATPTTTVERPEYIPEKFWKGSIEESAKVMATSYSELERKQGSTPTEGTETPAADPTPDSASTPAVDTTAVESALTTAAGNAADLKATLDWARANASEEQKSAFDAALDANNPALAALVFGNIKQSYTEAMGSQGTRVTGEAVPTTVGAKPFASQQEIIEFVNSKGYKIGDKRVHAEYEARMKVTNW